MTASLTNTVTLLADSTFKSRVQAAMTEQAVTVANDTTGSFDQRTARSALAMAIISDPEAYVRVFAPLCADDSTISAATTATDVQDSDIRRVVAAMWSPVAAAVPNLR